MPPRPAKRRLRLESLEIRALLAGDVGSDLAKAMAAVQGSAPIEGSLDSRSSSHLLELAGHGTEAVIIDLDRLPSTVTRLSLSNFASVTMSGTDSVKYLMASDVQSLFAPNLSVQTGVYFNNVASANLEAAGQYAFLAGPSTDFSVRSLAQTTIYSDLQLLTIQSETKDLNVENRNSHPIIQVKGHPDSITVAGIDSSSAVVFLDAGGPTVSVPATTGGNDIVTTAPHSDPETEISQPNTPVVFVVKTLDERTLVFIAELQKSLLTSPKDSQKLVHEFLNHFAPDAKTGTAAAANSVRAVIHANPRELELAQHRMTVAVGTEPGETGPSVDATGGVMAVKPIFDSFTDQPLELPQATLPLTLELSRRVDIDATWPVAIVMQEPSENSTPFVPLGLGQPEPVEPKLEDSIRAFTDYVVERVTAEFSPGQQSLVLLVDPKSTRPAGLSQGSALDTFGSATRTSLAGLRQVMS